MHLNMQHKQHAYLRSMCMTMEPLARIIGQCNKQVVNVSWIRLGEVLATLMARHRWTCVFVGNMKYARMQTYTHAHAHAHTHTYTCAHTSA